MVSVHHIYGIMVPALISVGKPKKLKGFLCQNSTTHAYQGGQDIAPVPSDQYMIP